MIYHLVVKVTLLLYVMILYSLSAQTPNMVEIAGATKSCRQLHMTDEIQYVQMISFELCCNIESLHAIAFK